MNMLVVKLFICSLLSCSAVTEIKI
jgi:hypothetical protein